LLLAVSGGPDSTALPLMAAGWAGGPALYAATVDHALRPESAAEAQAVAALAAGLGVPHRTLRWEGEKPATRLQERARNARYGLLEAEAERVGAKVVVTAHHLDDQAETVLMRLARGSGIAGLAGMAARTRRGAVEIARPLLGVAKSDLIAFCDARGVAYARDPSNANPRFARPRLRGLAGTLAAEGLDAPALARLARRAALAEEALARMTEAAEARLGLARTGRCEAEALAGEPPEIVRRLLTVAISACHSRESGNPGGPHVVRPLGSRLRGEDGLGSASVAPLQEPPPSPPPLRGRAREGAPPDPLPLDAMERLAADLLAAMAARRRYAANVGSALVCYDGRGAVTVGPEPPRSAPEPPRSAPEPPRRS
jgi:tRNA(Ile)-lysidine synthase